MGVPNIYSLSVYAIPPAHALSFSRAVRKLSELNATSASNRAPVGSFGSFHDRYTRYCDLITLMSGASSELRPSPLKHGPALQSSTKSSPYATSTSFTLCILIDCFVHLSMIRLQVCLNQFPGQTRSFSPPDRPGCVETSQATNWVCSLQTVNTHDASANQPSEILSRGDLASDCAKSGRSCCVAKAVAID
jgi:hypothetical protein